MESPEVRRWPAPLAGRLAAEAGPEQVAALVATLWLQIDQALHPIIGHRGVAALYHRGVTLTAAAHPWLLVGHPGLLPVIDPAALRNTLVQRSAEEATAGGSALFQTFHALLTSLVGPSLTDRLLHPVWAHSSAVSPAQDSSS